MEKCIGMFGGAFDPPHLAHRALAEAALAQMNLDVLHVMPTGQAWHKARPLTDAAHRMAMCQLAFQGLPRLQLDDREIRRAGPSYTLDTLRELHADYPRARLFLIMGQDQARALPTWRGYEMILDIATICVADRDLLTGEAVPVSSEMDSRMDSRFVRLHMPPMDISATGIRTRIAEGQGFAPLVSPAVARYIEDHHLYHGTR